VLVWPGVAGSLKATRSRLSWVEGTWCRSRPVTGSMF
jgi:hypothetical protein